MQFKTQYIDYIVWIHHRNFHTAPALLYCAALGWNGMPCFKCTRKALLVGSEAWCSRFMSSAIGIGVEQIGSKHGLLKI